MEEEANTTNNTNSSNNTKPEMSEAEKDEKQKVLDDMKDEIKSFTNIFIGNGNSTEKVDKVMKTDIFTIQITTRDPNDTEKNDKKAVEERISVANFTECENKLKEKYNISQAVNLLLKKVEFDSKMDIRRANNPDASKGLTFDFINPITMEKLDAKICSEVRTPMKIPFKRSERLRIDIVQKSILINTGLDLYSNKAPAYHSRCVKSLQLDTGADVSINYKRSKMFQNTSVSCSEGCTYEGLDENRYVKCDCKTNGEGENSNTGETYEFDPLPSMNYGIVVCYMETYHDVKILIDYLFIFLFRRI
jgi:hypothetical protein